ncbi:hypothetical protein H5410_057316 [Solanum commersonii]|uniref:Uncharacterized protein n=1 Tax=Solanum commersonii TaxID=4109 RepID=A0A9J5WQI1_SOLCO|nr:hypothetical protein H5410_057316 [Solanum commersonii]
MKNKIWAPTMSSHCKIRYVVPAKPRPFADSTPQDLYRDLKFCLIFDSEVRIGMLLDLIFKAQSGFARRKVDDDIAIRVSDSIPRILNWKTNVDSPWQKYIEKYLFMPTKKIRLLEPRDYNAEILKLEPKGSSHGLDMLTNEVIELRKELIKSDGCNYVIRNAFLLYGFRLFG